MDLCRSRYYIFVPPRFKYCVYVPQRSHLQTMSMLAVVCFVPQDEFSLGKWDKSTVKGDGEHLIRPREEGAEGEGGTIVLEVRYFEF